MCVPVTYICECMCCLYSVCGVMTGHSVSQVDYHVYGLSAAFLHVWTEY